MEIKKGNYIQLIIGPIMDATGAVVINLAAANDVKYMIKTNPTDVNAAALVNKKIGNGVTINAPVLGSVTVTLNAPDTENLVPGEKYHALQIEYTANNIQEINIIEDTKVINQLTIIQDVVRKP